MSCWNNHFIGEYFINLVSAIYYASEKRTVVKYSLFLITFLGIYNPGIATMVILFN